VNIGAEKIRPQKLRIPEVPNHFLEVGQDIVERVIYSQLVGLVL
jgi:hypothetical protein